MFCESLETRRLLTVTLRPPDPPVGSTDPGDLPPECVTVVQDSNGNVTIKALDHRSGRKGSHRAHSLGQWNKGSSGKWHYKGHSNSAGSSGHSGGSSGGKVDDCEINVAVFEENGTLVVTEITTGATWDVTGATSVKIIGTKLDDDIFYTGNSIGAQITAGSGNDTIVVADVGGQGAGNNTGGKSVVKGEKGNDSITLLIGNRTTLYGGDGNDTIFVNTGVGVYDTSTAEAIVFADGGTDTIVVYDGSNTLNGGSGSDTVIEVGGVNVVTSATVVT